MRFYVCRRGILVEQAISVPSKPGVCLADAELRNRVFPPLAERPPCPDQPSSVTRCHTAGKRPEDTGFRHAFYLAFSDEGGVLKIASAMGDAAFGRRLAELRLRRGKISNEALPRAAVDEL